MILQLSVNAITLVDCGCRGRSAASQLYTEMWHDPTTSSAAAAAAGCQRDGVMDLAGLHRDLLTFAK